MAENKALAYAVVSVAGWEVLKAYQNTAPSLADLRDTDTGSDPDTVRKLWDADILVGSASLALGVAVAYMTKDQTALAVMAAMFGTVALVHHAVLKSRSF